MKKYTRLNLTPEEQAFVDQQERMWKVLDWNKNTDEVINSLLKLHSVSLPADSELERYKDMSAEEIYAEIQKLKEK